MRNRQRFAFSVVVAGICLVLAGCGGGVSQKEHDELQAELEAAEQELMEEQAAREQAETDRKKAEDDAAAAAAAAATAEADEQAAETARQQAEQERDQARQEAEETQRQLTEAEQAELRARASSFATHLDLADGTTGGVMATPTVSWPRGSNLTFRPSGTLTPGSAAPSVPGGWRSASFTGQTGTATALVDETVYLYTNIQAPGTRAFWKVHGLTETMSSTLEPSARGSSATPTRDPNDKTMYTALTVSGSLNGASGKFTCGACTGTVADGYDSHVTFSQGAPDFGTESDWVFTPSSIANGYRVDQDDAYLYFGIWSSIPKGISGTAYDFRYMAGGGAESGSDLTNFGALTGSATFRGGAVGRYVTQGQVGGQNATIGTFTATATLNADFGDATAQGSLSGSITDFREGGSPLSGWQVTLGSDGNVGVASTIAGGAAGGDTVANIGGLSVGGSWGATFRGSDNEGVTELTDTVKYPPTQYPPVDLAGVSGWFDATGSNASLAGAFAATPSN